MVIFFVVRFVRSESACVKVRQGQRRVGQGGWEVKRDKALALASHEGENATRRSKTINQHGKKEHATKRECKTYETER